MDLPALIKQRRYTPRMRKALLRMLHAKLEDELRIYLSPLRL